MSVNALLMIFLTPEQVLVAEQREAETLEEERVHVSCTI